MPVFDRSRPDDEGVLAIEIETVSLPNDTRFGTKGGQLGDQFITEARRVSENEP